MKISFETMHLLSHLGDKDAKKILEIANGDKFFLHNHQFVVRTNVASNMGKPHVGFTAKD